MQVRQFHVLHDCMHACLAHYTRSEFHFPDPPPQCIYKIIPLLTIPFCIKSGFPSNNPFCNLFISNYNDSLQPVHSIIQPGSVFVRNRIVPEKVHAPRNFAPFVRKRIVSENVHDPRNFAASPPSKHSHTRLRKKLRISTVSPISMSRTLHHPISTR
jgi:hypothetical protein